MNLYQVCSNYGPVTKGVTFLTLTYNDNIEKIFSETTRPRDLPSFKFVQTMTLADKKPSPVGSRGTASFQLKQYIKDA